MSGEVRHRWRYSLSANVVEPVPTVAAAVESSGVHLFRHLPDLGLEAVLQRDGSWHDTHVFLDIRSKGEVTNMADIEVAAARQVVAAWRELGRVEPGPSVEELVAEFVPLDLAEQADQWAARRIATEELRRGPGLSAAEADGVRAIVFGGRDLAPEWAAEARRVVVPVRYVDALAIADERGHIVDAYRCGGVDELWLVTRTPEPPANRPLPPHGVSVPVIDAGVSALADLLYLTEHVITDPAATRLLMDLGDYWLVAGPSQFVTDVLGQSIPGAFAAFGEYAADADGETAELLAAVLAEHPPPA